MDPLLASIFGGGGAIPGMSLPYPQNAVSPWEPTQVTPAPTGSIGSLPPEVSPDASPAASTNAQGGGTADKLLSALRGVQAPPKPDVVKPQTPQLPRQASLQQNVFFDLLNSLSNPRAAAPRLTTLGGALGTGRY